MKCPVCNSDIDEGLSICPMCGSPIGEEELPEDMEETEKKERKPGRGWKITAVIFIVLAVILAAAVFCAIYYGWPVLKGYKEQSIQLTSEKNQLETDLSDREDQITELTGSLEEAQNTIAEHETTIGELTAQLETANTNLTTLQETADTYEAQLKDWDESYKDAVNTLLSEDFGEASALFCSEKYIIVTDVGEKYELNLTAVFDGDVTAEADSEKVAVTVAEREDSLTAVATIEGVATGMTTVTFSNSANEETFQILVMVVEP